MTDGLNVASGHVGGKPHPVWLKMRWNTICPKFFPCLTKQDSAQGQQ